jgi:hypothetical protein
LLVVGLLAVLTLAGCAMRLPAWARIGPAPAAVQTATKATKADATPTPTPAATPPDLSAPPAPQWRTTREALGLNTPAAEPVPVGEGGPIFTPFSQTLPELRREVALICGSARINKQQDYLAPLVTDLYLSNVDPAFATEALIQGDCGSLAAVVRELVAQGGNTVVAAVLNRAIFLSGPGAEGTIRAAASSGLKQDLVTPVQRSEPARETGTLAYSMAYFPSQAAAYGVASAAAPGTLYSNATPGFGIYTFVLLGGTFDPAEETQRARYAELLRIIETYVLAGAETPQSPTPESHAFLIAIRPEEDDDTTLIERSAPELSAGMRSDLSRYLRSRNQAELAERLTLLPGPFLISSLEPRLLPSNAVAPRLVTDLSNIGTEYLYAVVDAYDRPVPAEQQGRPEGLTAIRDRLLGLFSRKVSAVDLSPALKDAWVFRLGAQPPAVTEPAAPAVADQGNSAPAAKQAAAKAAPPAKKVPKRASTKAVRRS